MTSIIIEVIMPKRSASEESGHERVEKRVKLGSEPSDPSVASSITMPAPPAAPLPASEPWINLTWTNPPRYPARDLCFLTGSTTEEELANRYTGSFFKVPDPNWGKLEYEVELCLFEMGFTESLKDHCREMVTHLLWCPWYWLSRPFVAAGHTFQLGRRSTVRTILEWIEEKYGESRPAMPELSVVKEPLSRVRDHLLVSSCHSSSFVCFKLT